MFGLFNKLILFGIIFSLSSCLLFEEEEEIKDVYLTIPVEYSHVIKPIRALNANDIIQVKSNNGLLDQLICKYNTSEINYKLLKKIIKEDDRFYSVYTQDFDQYLQPDLYNFYNIRYSINYNRLSTFVEYNPLDFCLSVQLNQDELFKINLIDSTIFTSVLHTDLGNEMLDSVQYSHLYKFELPFIQFKNEDIKTVYFDMQKGIVRFDKYTGEIFYLNK